MSATNRGKKRNPADFYPTPPEAVWALLDACLELGALRESRWLEPCVGDGAIIRAVNAYAMNRWNDKAPIWDTCDIRPECAEQVVLLKNVDGKRHLTGSFLECADSFINLAPKVILTNPPFTYAQEIINTSLDTFPKALVIMMLSLNFLGTIKRNEWWRQRMPNWIGVLSDRPFPDSTEYAWYVWNLYNHQGPCNISVLPPFNWEPVTQLKLEPSL